MPTQRKPCPNEALLLRMTRVDLEPIDGSIVVPLALWSDLMAVVCCNPAYPGAQCAVCRGRERSRRYYYRQAMPKVWHAATRKTA